MPGSLASSISSLLAPVAALAGCAAVVLPGAPIAPAEAAGPPARASIIGGVPATEGTFTSAAFILDVEGKNLEQCTGTVIAPSLVLTAGHCVENMTTGAIDRASGFRVVTGQVDWASGEPQVSTVLGVIPYPGFARRLDAGDAALLVLSAPVAAPAIALASGAQLGLFGAGTPATIAGWGKTSFEDKALTERLNFAPTVVQPAKWCERNARFFFAKWELCTIEPSNFATGGCNGDSGGPLLVSGHAEGESLEIGITVHGYGPCSTRRPTVYTRVDALSGWIRSWIAAYGQPVVRQAT